jgi:hypothetical protein
VVLSPHQAVEYLKELNGMIGNLAVVGFAGPDWLAGLVQIHHIYYNTRALG